MARRTKRRNTRKGSGKHKSRRKYVRKYTRKYKNARRKTRKNKMRGGGRRYQVVLTGATPHIFPEYINGRIDDARASIIRENGFMKTIDIGGEHKVRITSSFGILSMKHISSENEERDVVEIVGDRPGLAQLKEMGFAEVDANAALDANQGDVQMASEWLLQGDKAPLPAAAPAAGGHVPPAAYAPALDQEVDFGAMGRWLDGSGLGQYKQQMHTSGYDLDTLIDLDADDLEYMLLEIIPKTLPGHRIKMEKAMKALKEPKIQVNTAPAAAGGNAHGPAYPAQQFAHSLQQQHAQQYAQQQAQQQAQQHAQQHSPAAAQTITLSKKVTARNGDGKYKEDISPRSKITIYSGLNNENTMNITGRDGSIRRGLHYRVNHGSDWSWVSNYDLTQAGAHDPGAGGASGPAGASGPGPGAGAAAAGWSDGMPPARMCPYCLVKGQQPRAVYPGQFYCGRTCGQAAAAAGWVNGMPPAGAGPGPGAGATAGGSPGTRKILFYRKPPAGNFYEFTNFFYRDTNAPLFSGDDRGEDRGEERGEDRGEDPAALEWKTPEHYFQVYKFLHSGADIPTLHRQSRDIPTGNNGLNAMGPQWGAETEKRHPLDKNYWHGNGRDGSMTSGKDRAMYNAVKMKFKQNSDLLALLQGTGTALIIENAGLKVAGVSPGDKYWGDGKYGDTAAGGSSWDFTKIDDKEGMNKLGLLLMEIRDELTGGTTLAHFPQAHIKKDKSYDHSIGYFNLQIV